MANFVESISLGRIPGDHDPLKSSTKIRPYPNEWEKSPQLHIIKDENWDKKFPYSFMVVHEKNQKITESVSWKIFQLPFPPTDLTISIPFAINTTPTGSAILEEHNGVVFRNIVLTGTTGVAPFRETVKVSRAPLGLRILAGETTNAAVSTLQAFGSLVREAGLPDVEIINGVNLNINKTGYTLLHELAQYFVAYAEMKKNPGNDGFRLLFLNYKDNQFYIVSPISFKTRKTANRPHIYTYTIILKVLGLWHGTVPEREILKIGVEDPHTSANIAFNIMNAARKVVNNAENIIKSVTTDFEANVAFPIRQSIVLAKDTAKVKYTALDFPDALADVAADIINNFQPGSLHRSILDAAQEEVMGNKKHRWGRERLNQALNAGKESKDGGSDLGKSNSSLTNEVRGWIEKVKVGDLFPLDQFNLSSDTQTKIVNQILAVREWRLDDFAVRKAKIRKIEENLTSDANAGDQTYSDIYNVQPPSGAANKLDESRILLLAALNEILNSLNIMAILQTRKISNKVNPFQIGEANANNNEIKIPTPKSSFPVPLPFKTNLQDLAKIYLGNSSRWTEIAILNSLKPPYIDEEGFILSLLTSISSNSFLIAENPISILGPDRRELYIGQSITITSDINLKGIQRKIINIEKGNSSVITVDGEPITEAVFNISNNPKFHCFLPNTLNSNNVIYIPSDKLVSTEADINALQIKSIPDTEDLIKQERLMGVDVLLTKDFDFAILNDGNMKLATGFNNAVQALTLKMRTARGDLPSHPTYGVGIDLGAKNTLNAGDVKEDITNNILKDPRFTEIKNISILFDGPSVKVNVDVKTIGETGEIPITFEV